MYTLMKSGLIIIAELRRFSIKTKGKREFFVRGMRKRYFRRTSAAI